MATIDDKVVAMSFESGKFETGINKTISSLEKLKSALHFPNAGKGLQNIDSSAKKVNLGHISKSIDDIKSKLGFLSVAALAAFATIATKAVMAGTRMVKAFTLDPIKAGFTEYTTNLNAVQTILANTQASGAGLKEVNAALEELNTYSDKTIYNFSQMARNIGTFTAAGVDLDTSTAAIKGIANLAALSGSNAEQASTAMYQLSQAIAAGRVGLMDWNSVVNAGMGGTVFQRALAQTAEKMGTLKKGAVSLVGPMKNVKIQGESFRQSMQAGPGKTSWLTSDVLTSTLKQFTSDMTDAELKAQGFTASQIKDIQAMAQTAMKAATEVKTLTGVVDVARETAGSGWAKTWQILFGDFNEAKTLFTAVSGAVNGFINASADARNKVLGDWKALGGRTMLITAIKTAFQTLGQILKPIKEAFRDIFPATTGKDLMALTVQFKNFVDTVKPSPETLENLKRTFAGLFAILSIGKQIIGGIFIVFAKLFGGLSEGRGSFLNLTGNIGDFLVSVDQALKKGNKLTDFFGSIGNFLAAPLKLLEKLSDALSGLFGDKELSSGGISEQMSSLGSSMEPLQKVMTGVTDAWSKLMGGFSGSDKAFESTFSGIIKSVEGIGPAISAAISSMNFEAILSVIRTGLLGGIVVMFKQFLGKGSFMSQIGGAGGGIFGNISGAFGALEGSMKSLQTSLKAKTLKDIAIAIALLSVSIVALSFVNPDRLKSSLTAITVAFGQLLGAMAILGNIGSSMGFIKMPFITASMIALAGAIVVLSLSVMMLSQLSWDELLKGLTGVGVLLGIISVASIPLSANSGGMIRAGVGILAIAIALKILASAIADFGAMSWTEIGKGLLSVAVALGIMAGAAKIMPSGMVMMGAGLIIVAVALKMLADVIAKFGAMDMKIMGKGLIGIGGGLVVIAAAMHLMPKHMLLTAAGLLLVSFALKGISNAVERMGGMTVGQIAKGLITLALSLQILAASLIAMTGTMGGAFALSTAASGLALLVPALIVLGKQSWSSIFKGLITLAAALTILGVAGMLIAPMVPALLGLGAALLLIGGGLALAGVGIALIGVGLSAIAVAGPMAIGILIQSLLDLIEAIPEMAKNFILGLLEIVRAFAATAPLFVASMVKILDSLMNVIVQSSPKITKVFGSLILMLLQIIADNAPNIIRGGMNLLLDLLKGIRNNIGKIVTTVVDIIARFLTSISNNLGRITEGGVKILTSLLKGIGNGVSKVVTAAGSIVTKFLTGIGNSLGKIATAGLSILTKLLTAIATGLPRVITAGTNVIVNFIKGVGNMGPRIITAAVNAITKFIHAIGQNAVKLADEGALAIINFLNGVARVIEQRGPEMRAAGARIGRAIVQGMLDGIGELAGALKDKAASLGKSVVGGLGKALKLRSPSEVTHNMGVLLVEGLANGLSEDEKAIAASNALGNSVISAFKTLFQITSPSKVMHDIGIFVGEGFAEGLKGSQSDVDQAFKELNTKLDDEIRQTKETIAEEQAKLRELRKEKGKDRDIAAIRAATTAIAENKTILARLVSGHKELNTALADEHKELGILVTKYADITKKLEDAQKVLDDAIQKRDSYQSGLTDQYGELPGIVTTDKDGKPISPADQVANYTKALQDKAAAIAAYHATLEALRALGLDDATYSKLLSEGPDQQAFASALLSGGQAAVDQVNKFDGDIASQATNLAHNAAKNLYQAGVDMAQGLVDGLKSQQATLAKQMTALAKLIITAIKKALKIKSPSAEFAHLGQLSMEGMALGFSKSSRVVTSAIDDAAQDAMDAMRKSMSDISEVVTNELDVNPVITPILDLTQVQTEKDKLAALMSADTMNANVSLGQASAISSEQRALQTQQIADALGGSSVIFEQHNHSPEALSEIEIYRQTRNQLSLLKSALTPT